MKIFILADNTVGLEVTKYLVQKKENIVGLALHSKKYQKRAKELLKLVKQKIL